MTSDTNIGVQPKRHRKKKVTAFALGWLMTASIAFAAFNQYGTGTVSVSTTHPNDLTGLTIIGATSFSDADQNQPLEFRITGSNMGLNSYAKYTTQATAVTSGPCAGYVTVAAGQTGNWRNYPGNTADQNLSNGNTVRSTADSVQVNISPSAPNACADQAAISLPVKVLLHN